MAPISTHQIRAHGGESPARTPPFMHPLPPVMPFDWAVAHGQDRYGLWQAFEVKGVRLKLRWLPPGSFWMGSPEREAGRGGDEGRRWVSLTQGFWLAETVVTQALWLVVMGGESPAQFQDSLQHPVEQVSWRDINERFLPTLDAVVPGLMARLPTEAQWEYACREAGSAEGPFSFGGGITTEQANFDGNDPYPGSPHGSNREKTTSVDTFVPNRVGLREMHGGVWEWTSSAYGRYGRQSAHDPHGAAAADPQAAERVLRGGSWFDEARNCRSARRLARGPGYRDDGVGFRLARGPLPAAGPAEPGRR